VPVAAHRSTVEWLTSPHALESGLVVSTEDGVLRPGPIAWVHEEPPPPSLSPFPFPAKAPPPPPPPSDPPSPQPSPSGWLHGVVVLDLANVIAGPTIGSMLARYGAEVIKVDPPTPTYSPEVTVLYGLAANAGKRSLLLDVKSADGRAALLALLRRATILVLNATEDCAARLRLTPQELHAINPNLILARFDAFGGPREAGPLAPHVAYDDNLQAALGIMERFGGGMGRVEEHAHVGTIDVVAGVGGAFAACSALLLAAKPRRGLLVARASLASVGQLVQFPFCCGTAAALSAAAAAAPTRLGPECRGEHALLRCYEGAGKSWLLLCASLLPACPAASPAPQHALLRLAAAHPAFAAAADAAMLAARRGADAEEAMAAHLAAAFACRPAAEWVELLRRAGVDAVPLASLASLRAAHTRPEAACDVGLAAPTFQFLAHAHHPVGALTMFAPCAVRSARGGGLVVPLRHAPKYGAHTRELLAEAGIDAPPLLQRAVAALSWSEQYLPRQRGARTTCPVCLGAMERAIQLVCAHALCADCAQRCSDAGHTRCPVCRHPHLLDPKALGARRDEWRTAYAGWRKGHIAGAVGEVVSIVAPEARQGKDKHRSSAGDLMVYMRKAGSSSQVTIKT